MSRHSLRRRASRGRLAMCQPCSRFARHTSCRCVVSRPSGAKRSVPCTRDEIAALTHADIMPSARMRMKGRAMPPFMPKGFLVLASVRRANGLEDLRGAGRRRLDYRRHQQERRDHRSHHHDASPYLRHCVSSSTVGKLLPIWVKYGHAPFSCRHTASRRRSGAYLEASAEEARPVPSPLVADGTRTKTSFAAHWSAEALERWREIRSLVAPESM